MTYRIRNILIAVGLALVAMMLTLFYVTNYKRSVQKSTSGVPVYVAVKDLTAEAGLRSSTNILRTQSTLELRDMLLLDIVRWSVERFFGYSRKAPMAGGAQSQVKPS